MDKQEYWDFTCPKCGGRSIMTDCACTGGTIRIPITLEAGMLLSSETGKSWYYGEILTKHASFQGGNIIGDLWCGICTPLLPSPATLKAHGLTAWDALKLLCDDNCPNYLLDQGRDWQWPWGFSLEASRIITGPEPESCGGGITGPYMSTNFTICAQTVDAVQRDLQKYKALLQWLDGFKEVD